MIVESIDVEGPLFSPGDPLPESHRKIIFRSPKIKADFPAKARAILDKFASRAYRRPVTEAELARLLKLVDLAIQNGDN